MSTFSEFINKQADSNTMAQLRESFPNIRICHERGLLTQDYDSTRLNVYVDASGKITSFDFG